MLKKVLVLGGSYFVGRVFNILASRSNEFEIVVVNRGRYDLKLDNVSQVHIDRHNSALVNGVVPGDTFDAIIDFCAYEPGDIALFTRSMLAKTKQYIYISTASVYDPLAPTPVTEAAKVAEDFGQDENGLYVRKKLLLETELQDAARYLGFSWTIFRPTFIYGPFNYAPREPMYFQNLLNGMAIPQPTDAAAKFNLVYVKDVARMIMAATANERAYNEVFNLSAPEALTYDSFLAELEKLWGKKIETVPVTCAEAAAQGIPLPFPLQLDEVYDGGKAVRLLGEQYTPFTGAFKETYEIYMKAMAR